MAYQVCVGDRLLEVGGIAIGKSKGDCFRLYDCELNASFLVVSRFLFSPSILHGKSTYSVAERPNTRG